MGLFWCQQYWAFMDIYGRSLEYLWININGISMMGYVYGNLYSDIIISMDDNGTFNNGNCMGYLWIIMGHWEMEKWDISGE